MQALSRDAVNAVTTDRRFDAQSIDHLLNQEIHISASVFDSGWETPECLFSREVEGEVGARLGESCYGICRRLSEMARQWITVAT